MIDKELQISLINRALAKGGEYADIFTEYRKHTSLVLEDRKLEKIAYRQQKPEQAYGLSQGVKLLMPSAMTCPEERCCRPPRR